MSSPVVVMMRMLRSAMSIRIWVLAWRRPMPMWCRRPLWRRGSLPSVSMRSVRTRQWVPRRGAVVGGGGFAVGVGGVGGGPPVGAEAGAGGPGFGSGGVGLGGGGAVAGAVRAAGVVVLDEGVEVVLQLADAGGGIAAGEPFLD